jgi:hypothetical protein
MSLLSVFLDTRGEKKVPVIGVSRFVLSLVEYRSPESVQTHEPAELGPRHYRNSSSELRRGSALSVLR